MGIIKKNSSKLACWVQGCQNSRSKLEATGNTVVAALANQALGLSMFQEPNPFTLIFGVLSMIE